MAHYGYPDSGIRLLFLLQHGILKRTAACSPQAADFSVFTNYGFYKADDLGLRAVDGFIGIVFRKEPHLAFFSAQTLNGGFVTDKGNHDLPIVGSLLGADYHFVPAQDTSGAYRPVGGEIHGATLFRCFETSYLNMFKQQLGTRESIINLSGGRDRKDFAKEVVLTASIARE